MVQVRYMYMYENVLVHSTYLPPRVPHTAHTMSLHDGMYLYYVLVLGIVIYLGTQSYVLAWLTLTIIWFVLYSYIVVSVLVGCVIWVWVWVRRLGCYPYVYMRARAFVRCVSLLRRLLCRCIKYADLQGIYQLVYQRNQLYIIFGHGYRRFHSS